MESRVTDPVRIMKMEPVQTHGYTPAHDLAVRLGDLLPGLQAHDDRLTVPVAWASGCRSVQIEITHAIFTCAEAIVWSSYRALGLDEGEAICDRYGITVDVETPRFISAPCLFIHKRPAVLLQFLRGLDALVERADGRFPVTGVRQRPGLPPPGPEQARQLGHCAAEVEIRLRQAIHFHSGGSGLERMPVTAPEGEHCQRIAREAVYAALPTHVHIAEARARAAVSDLLQQAQDDAMVLDRDHSQRDLIAQALTRYRRTVEHMGLVQVAIQLYRHTLRGGDAS